MIQTEIRFPSAHLGMRVSMNVLLPENGAGPFATLYLLHGLSDDHTIWSRLTRIEPYASRWPMAIVMPQGFRGFYTDHARGPNYAKYIMEDVIGTAQRMLPLRRDGASRAIGGLSMGGYGAMRIGLGDPAAFASIHSHSGCLLYGTVGRARDSVLSQAEYESIFGDAPADTAHDLLYLAEQAKQDGIRLPALHVDCGVDDFLIEQNRAFQAAMAALQVPLTYRENAGGHSWDYWDAHIARAIEFHAKAMGLEPAGLEPAA